MSVHAFGEKGSFDVLRVTRETLTVPMVREAIRDTFGIPEQEVRDEASWRLLLAREHEDTPSGAPHFLAVALLKRSDYGAGKILIRGEDTEQVPPTEVVDELTRVCGQIASQQFGLGITRIEDKDIHVEPAPKSE